MISNKYKYVTILIFILLFASIKFFFADQNQRPYSQGHYPHPYKVKKNTPVNSSVDDLNRNVTQIIYSRHAKCRMECRHIDTGEIKEILANGIVNKRKIEKDDRGTTYPLEGTANGHHLRVVFAPKGQNAVEVVTCIDLDTEWQCDCN